MRAYYNDINKFCCTWLENLIKSKLISSGYVDCKTIHEVVPIDFKGFSRCHFFAGIGGWDLALQLAGWPDDVPVWTGSCPCQPFSIAGRQKGAKDERYLWPEWKRLIKECLPPVIFGEQVASPLGRTWLDAVSSDLEALGYAVGAADLCAASVGAPHTRQRLWFVAERLAYTESAGLQGRLPRRTDTERKDIHRCSGCHSTTDGMDRCISIDSFWSDCDWLFCKDGKWRPVESGTFPLADGVSQRVGLLRSYGNAIVPQVAAIFIKAFWDKSKKHKKDKH